MHCVELYYSDCKWPDWVSCEDPGWNPSYRRTLASAWRERALRAAAVWPCTGRSFVLLFANDPARVAYAHDYRPACTQYSALAGVCWCWPDLARFRVRRFPYACA